MKAFHPGRYGWRLYDPVARRLPGTVAGLLDLLIPGIGFGYGVCNGQRGREAMLRELVDLIDPTAIIETGTFRGMTTAFLAQLTSSPVYSVEVNKRFYVYAALRLARVHQIHVSMRDSREFIRELAETGGAGARPVFYLDAHCHLTDVSALDDEVAIIDESWPNAVMVIDDARVADDPGYGYDEYNGRPLGLDTLAVPAARFEAFYPALPSSEETGWRRGAVVLATRGDLAPRLQNALTLRRAAM